ncbi:MAG: hypothetical protein ACF8PN_08665 [Phycisphaerales bacterium]
MREGWLDDVYVFVFDAEESARFELDHGFAQWLPGYSLRGLWNWCEFIVTEKPAGESMSLVCTVPLIAKYLEPLAVPVLTEPLEPDERWRGRIRWLRHPVIFGGKPKSGEYDEVDFATHAKLVRFWNKLYREVKQI